MSLVGELDFLGERPAMFLIVVIHIIKIASIQKHCKKRQHIICRNCPSKLS